MKSILQLLSRIGDVMVVANVDNRFEFERLMRARREEDLGAPKTSRTTRATASRQPTKASRLYAVAKPADARKPIKPSIA